MSRRLLLALLAPMLAAATAAAVSTSAQAGYRPRSQVCVTAKYNTWLRGCDDCRRWVDSGRAFRVQRQDGGQFQVWNWEMDGWMYLRELRLADDRFCRAAGI